MENNNSTYYIIGGVGVVILLYIIFNKTKQGKEVKQIVIQQANDLSFNTASTTNVITSDGAYNNPGNIRTSDITYEGEITSNSATFKSFESLDYGYRAMIELLRAYYIHDNCTTLQQMINRYAPSGDGSNDPTAYATTVSNATGVSLTEDMQSVLYSPTIVAVITSMSEVEQGNNFTAQNGVSQSATNGYNLA